MSVLRLSVLLIIIPENKQECVDSDNWFFGSSD